MALDEKTDTKQEKRESDVMTVVKRLPLFFFYSLFANYFFTLVSLGIINSFFELRELLPDMNALPVYGILFPFTFGFMTWILSRKRKHNEF